MIKLTDARCDIIFNTFIEKAYNYIFVLELKRLNVQQFEQQKKEIMDQNKKYSKNLQLNTKRICINFPKDNPRFSNFTQIVGE